MRFLDEEPNFKSFIKNICVYSPDIQKSDQLKRKYNLIDDVVSSKEGVINFIKNFSFKEIEPYHITKVITLNEYLENYKDIHKKISQFYGDLDPQMFKDNIKKMSLLINQEDKENKLCNKNKNCLIDGFLCFDLNKDIEILDKLIIRESSKNNSFYDDLNWWPRNPNFKSFEVVAYLQQD